MTTAMEPEDSPEEESEKQEPAEKPEGGGEKKWGGDKTFERSADVEELEQTPIDKLFGKANRLERERGTPFQCPGLEDALKIFKQTRVLVVAAGVREDHLDWVATHVALRGSFQRWFRATAIEHAVVEYWEMVAKLTTQPACCLVLDCFNASDSERFRGSFRDFVTEVAALRETNSGMIVTVRSGSIEDLRSGGDWPSHVPFLEIPYESPVSGLDDKESESEEPSKTPQERLENLFRPPLDTFEDIVDSEGKLLIPRTLVRLAVLLPTLSASNHERLLEHVLQGRQIEVRKPKKKKEGRAEPAINLWRAGKLFFEKQAALTRSTSGGVQTFLFENAEAYRLAEQLAWQDADSMYQIFSEISNLNVLFADAFDSEDQALFEQYLSAAGQLARRAPSLFGSGWLEAASVGYAGWVQHEMVRDEKESESTDIFAILARVMRNQEKGRRMWRHFTRRMGILCSSLIRSECWTVVDQFLDRLCRNSFQPVALDLLSQIGDLEADENLRWFKRIVSQGEPSVRQAATQQMAADVIRSAPDILPAVKRKIGWLRTLSGDSGSSTFGMAMAFPYVLFEHVARRQITPEAESTLLTKIFDAELEPSETFFNYCQDVLGQLEYAKCVKGHMEHGSHEAQPPSHYLAFTIYHAAVSLPDAAFDKALALRAAGLEPYQLGEKTEVRQWWKVIAEHWESQLAKTPRTDSTKRERFQRHYSIAKKLVRG